MLEPFPAGEFPNLADFITEDAMKPGYDYEDEFEYGLDVILDGLREGSPLGLMAYTPHAGERPRGLADRVTTGCTVPIMKWVRRSLQIR